MHSDHLAVTASVTYGASVKNVGGEASVKLPLALVSPIPIIKEPGKPGDATDIVFVTLSSTAVETAVVQCTSRCAMAR